jgi:hypothetical protein
MKAIIDNKLYDTEKATLIHQHVRKIQRKSILNTTILVPVDYDLYKTAKGNWFEVAKERDSLKKPTIFSLTEERVKQIMLNFPDEYQKLFGIVEEA